MVEQVASSGDWRAAVAYAARQQLDQDNQAGTYLDAVRVTIRLQFAPPKSWKGYTRPTSRATGDVDKHARNILDALVDAAVIKDDAQVAALVVSKQYCRGAQTPGAIVEVTGVSGD